MTKTAEQIVALFHEREKRFSHIHQVGAQIKKVYNGEYIIPLPELERAERNSVANIIQEGIDQHAQRIASVMPDVYFPATSTTGTAVQRAEDRRLAVMAWYHLNRMPQRMRRRARHLIAYATSPIYVRPGPDGYPVWELRDPLATYPALMDPDELVPTDVIFAIKRTVGWLRDKYGTQVDMLPLNRDAGLDSPVQLLQYCDANEYVFVAVGAPDTDNPDNGPDPTHVPAMELSRVSNLAGIPTVVIPGRITLDRLQGQFDQMIGQYETQGLLWAMHLQALKRSIFPDSWIIGQNESNPPQIVRQADPYTGEIGMAVGGQFERFSVDPSVQTLPTIDRIERNERLTGNVPSEFGGESPSNVRTARRGGQVLSSAIDYQIQEHQEQLASSLHEENKIAIKIAKAYWGSQPRTFYVPFGRGTVTYTPDSTFETDMHDVSYAYSGTDTSALVVEAGQRLGQGTLSKLSFMRVDPMVKDPPFEHQQVLIEMLEQAHMGAIQQQAANPQGGYPPEYLARLTELLVEKRMPLYKAEQQAHQELQAQQAAQQQQQVTPEQMQPGNAPAGAPGTPGAGVPIQGPNPAQMNLADLASALTRPRRVTSGQAANPAVPAPA